jgi:sugar transferase EpsL
MPRFFDFLFLMLAAPLLLPIFAVAYLLAFCDMGRAAFFSQPRGGFKGCVFEIYKFRTMTNARDAHGNLLPDNERITPVGRFLRATSLDELPSIWNVLRGDIRLVGPRPFMAQYLPLYSEEQARRHDVLPGLTGWAQINGRNALTWEEKFALDIWYVDHRSFMLDMQILWLTMAKVLRRDGVNSGAETTMPLFEGSKAK